MFEPAQTYEGEMSFDHEDDLNHLFKSFICIVAHATGHSTMLFNHGWYISSYKFLDGEGFGMLRR